jgi:protease-4
MQPNEGFGESVLRTFFKVFAGMMGLVFSGIVGIVILGGVAAVFTQEELDEAQVAEYRVIEGDDDADVLLVSIPIEGVILGEPSANDVLNYFSELGVTYGYAVKQQLAELAEDDLVDGVILEIHSPGGTIFGSKAITDGVDAYKAKTGKPVFAYIGSMAASGGYWAAASADEIIADHGVTLGSIGVIAGPFKYYDSVVSEDGGAFLGGVVTQKGISTRYITAGTSKDIGNPYREMTEGEVAILQQAVNNAYQKFVNYVSQQRKISTEKITNELGAMIYDEQQSVQLELVDMIGNKQNAYQALADSISQDATYQVKQITVPLSFVETLLMSKQLFSQQPAVSVCPINASILAYHGDITSLCR